MHKSSMAAKASRTPQSVIEPDHGKRMPMMGVARALAPKLVPCGWAGWLTVDQGRAGVRHLLPGLDEASARTLMSSGHRATADQTAIRSWCLFSLPVFQMSPVRMS